MRHRSMVVLWVLGLAVLSGCGATAGQALLVPLAPSHVAGVNPLFPTNSYDAHIRNLLIGGRLADALGFAKEHYGRVPAWLQRYAAAFDAAKRTVGQCQDVAKAIHGGLSRLGERPEYVALRSNWEYMTFRLPDGPETTISRSGYHVVVRAGQMVYDAYTGPAGMRYSDYLARLLVRPGFNIETAVVHKP